MAAEPMRFEQAMAELERTLRDLEDGSTSLDDALARYERGIALVRHCHLLLGQAELRIKELTAITPDGKPDIRDFEHAAALEKPRSQRRSRDDDDSER